MPSDCPTRHECEAAEGATRAYDRIERLLLEQRPADAVGLDAWEMRCDMVRYFEIDALLDALGGYGIEGVATLIDDAGHWCCECGEARVPGPPPVDGPTCEGCAEERVEVAA